MLCPVIHIVKRFGRVGGMEGYMWQLVHGLADRGIDLTVVCEQVCEPPGAGVRILEVEASPERPRWKSMMTFRTRVDKKIRDAFRGQAVIVHSHERSLCHQVTTFHGPPIEPPRGFAWLSRFNKRVAAWQQLERDELLGPSVQMVLPVSSQVQGQLTSRYPEIIGKKIDLAWPGVYPSEVDSSVSTRMDSDHVRFVFVGKEWRRKGLDIAVRVVEEFRKTHSTATLSVFGLDPTTLPRAMRARDWISFQGWSSEIPWSDFDVLLHPARKEPFGMVVAEARSFGVPVVMSSQVGAADLELTETKILDIDAPLAEWCHAASELIQTNTRERELKWTWSDLVAEHIETIYPQLEAVTL